MRGCRARRSRASCVFQSVARAVFVLFLLFFVTGRPFRRDRRCNLKDDPSQRTVRAVRQLQDHLKRAKCQTAVVPSDALPAVKQTEVDTWEACEKTIRGGPIARRHVQNVCQDRLVTGMQAFESDDALKALLDDVARLMRPPALQQRPARAPDAGEGQGDLETVMRRLQTPVQPWRRLANEHDVATSGEGALHFPDSAPKPRAKTPQTIRWRV